MTVWKAFLLMIYFLVLRVYYARARVLYKRKNENERLIMPVVLRNNSDLPPFCLECLAMVRLWKPTVGVGQLTADATVKRYQIKINRV